MSENLEDLKTEFEEALRDLDSEIAAKDATIEDLSRKLEEARGRIGALESQVTLHKEIAAAREFDFHEAEKRIADLTIEADRYIEEMTHLRNEADADDARIAELESALEFYADPETYHAISFMADPPCGQFMEDFSKDHGGNYDRPMPGRLARRQLAAHRAMIKAEKEQGE